MGYSWAVADAPGETGLNAVASVLQGLGIEGTPAELSPPERITSKSLTYDQIVDELLLSPPGETQGALAKRLGYTQSWLCTLMASDAFQAKLHERIEKSVEPERQAAFKLRFASIEEEARGILKNSLRLLAEKLEQPAELIPPQLVIKSVEVTSKLLGYGARDVPGTPQRVDMHLHLHQLRENLMNLNQAPDVSDATIVATVPAGQASGDKP
jgi:hypothetical protein